jgi:hypothetical protein
MYCILIRKHHNNLNTILNLTRCHRHSNSVNGECKAEMNEGTNKDGERV